MSFLHLNHDVVRLNHDYLLHRNIRFTSASAFVIGANKTLMSFVYPTFRFFRFGVLLQFLWRQGIQEIQICNCSLLRTCITIKPWFRFYDIFKTYFSHFMSKLNVISLICLVSLRHLVGCDINLMFPISLGKRLIQWLWTRSKLSVYLYLTSPKRIKSMIILDERPQIELSMAWTRRMRRHLGLGPSIKSERWDLLRRATLIWIPFINLRRGEPRIAQGILLGLISFY